MLLVTKYFFAAWTSRFPLRNRLKQKLLESRIKWGLPQFYRDEFYAIHDTLRLVSRRKISASIVFTACYSFVSKRNLVFNIMRFKFCPTRTNSYIAFSLCEKGTSEMFS